MKSREHFILQVKETILKEHAKEDNTSFIFGLSGKWGEGKTKFLEGLALELEKVSFEKPIWVSPWKYGDDRVSFLRNFLKNISQYATRSPLTWLRDLLNNKDDFRDLYHDTSKREIHWGLFIVLLLIVLDIILFYLIILHPFELIYPSYFLEVKKYYPIIAAFILSPIFIPLLNSSLTIQQSNKSVSTIDQFDLLLDKFLKSLKKKKIVVFVDDLDRVTPEIARNVLDNLRIFFDKPQITFVVTGDHTVLERYIGSLTMPSVPLEVQQEEGRRYLKKVFNLYWRLPLPLDSEFDEFLEELFEKHDTELRDMFKSEDNKMHFALYLKRYFDKNFRQTIRFFDTVLFTFEIIKGQHEDAVKNTKKYYKQMLENPLLVVRILMIQELCMPLFDAISKDTGELRNLEYLVEMKHSEEVDRKLKSYGSLTPGQEVFIRKFLYEEPRFFKNRILDVYAFEPFLYLSADANLGDARGLTKEDFIAVLETGDPDQVANSIENSGEEKIREEAKGITELLGRVTNPSIEPNVNAGYIQTVVTALTKIPDHPSQEIFIKALKDIDFSKIFSSTQLALSARLQLTQSFWRWLDTQTATDINEYYKFFPLLNPGDIIQLDFSNPPLGHFSSSVICKWLMSYYPSNREVILNIMITTLPNLDKNTIDEEFSGTIDTFTQDILEWGTEDQREKLYNVLLTYVPAARESLRKIVFEKVRMHNETVWQWALMKVADPHKPWLQEELELQIIQSLDDVSDPTNLLAVIRYAGNKIVKNIDAFWEVVGLNYSDKIIEIMALLVAESFPTFSPQKKIAKTFFRAALKKIELADDAQRIAQLPTLQNRWLFTKIGSLPNYQEIKRLGSSQNPATQREVNDVLQSWRKPLIETIPDVTR